MRELLARLADEHRRQAERFHGIAEEHPVLLIDGERVRTVRYAEAHGLAARAIEDGARNLHDPDSLPRRGLV